jgi:hypothetical protein
VLLRRGGGGRGQGRGGRGATEQSCTHSCATPLVCSEIALAVKDAEDASEGGQAVSREWLKSGYRRGCPWRVLQSQYSRRPKASKGCGVVGMPRISRYATYFVLAFQKTVAQSQCDARVIY